MTTSPHAATPAAAPHSTILKILSSGVSGFRQLAMLTIAIALLFAQAANAEDEDTYSVSASSSTLDFGSLAIPYTQPAVQTVTITNTGTGSVTLTQPTSTNYIIGNLSVEKLDETATFTIQPKANLAVRTYNETITVSSNGSVVARVQAHFGVIPADLTPSTYYIFGNGTSFDVIKGGVAIANGSKVTIQSAINAIKTDASAAAATIQFENGTDVLNIGGGDTTQITFDRSGTPAWGLITLMGKLTSSGTSSNGIILLTNGASIDSKAQLTATSWGNPMIRNNGTGTVTISGGTVSSGYYAVYGNRNGGRVDISGGTVSATSGYAVYNNYGTVNFGGSPTINGKIGTNGNGNFAVIGGFAPGVKVYTLELDFAASTGMVVVEYGADYLPNFTLASSSNGVNFSLSPEGDDLVLASATYGYAVAASGTTYTITKGTGEMASVQEAIDYITTQMNDAACTIQFGDGTNTLDIGGGSSTLINFNTSGGCSSITLTGKLTSAATGNIIEINGVSIDSKAELTATSSGTLIYDNGGAITISGGVVSTTGWTAVYSNNGTITISDGEVSAPTSNYAVCSDYGAITISGGEVSARDYAVRNNNGAITISGGTVSATSYAVYNHYNGAITISGGEVSATSGTAVYSDYGDITISGGTVQAKEGYAVYKGTGATTITGGLLFAYGTDTTDVIYGDYNATGIDAVIAAWDNTAGNTEYPVFSSGDIFKFPATATAVWVNKEGKAGISASNSAKISFAAVEDVTVNKAVPTAPTNLTATAGQTLANVTLPAGWSWATPTASVGAVGTQPHMAKYTPNPDNYTTLTDIPVSITVSKVKITKPTVTAVSLVYIGSEQSAGIAANAAYTVSGDKGTDAGVYSAKVALSDKANREWSDGTDTTDIELAWTIAKATAATPAGLTATAGQTLANVTLPAGWAWATPTASVGTTGAQTHKANYTPSDTVNYNALTGINVSITVNAGTPIIAPQIASGSIRVQATANAIILENLPRNAKVEVYNLHGKQIYSAYPENPSILKIGVQTKGMYIVKAGSQSVKVAVR